jgi:hypothetical protein
MTKPAARVEDYRSFSTAFASVARQLRDWDYLDCHLGVGPQKDRSIQNLAINHWRVCQQLDFLENVAESLSQRPVVKEALAMTLLLRSLLHADGRLDADCAPGHAAQLIHCVKSWFHDAYERHGTVIERTAANLAAAVMTNADSPKTPPEALLTVEEVMRLVGWTSRKTYDNAKATIGPPQGMKGETAHFEQWEAWIKRATKKAAKRWPPSYHEALRRL